MPLSAWLWAMELLPGHGQSPGRQAIEAQGLGLPSKRHWWALLLALTHCTCAQSCTCRWPNEDQLHHCAYSSLPALPCVSPPAPLSLAACARAFMSSFRLVAWKGEPSLGWDAGCPKSSPVAHHLHLWWYNWSKFSSLSVVCVTLQNYRPQSVVASDGSWLWGSLRVAFVWCKCARLCEGRPFFRPCLVTPSINSLVLHRFRPCFAKASQCFDCWFSVKIECCWGGACLLTHSLTHSRFCYKKQMWALYSRRAI